MNINKVILAGRICSEVEGKVTPSGLSILHLRIATNTKRKNRTTGEVIEDAQFNSCILFGKLADIGIKWLVKGQVILVIGRLSNTSWEFEGKKCYKTEILVDEMQMGQAPRGASPQDSSAPSENTSSENDVSTDDLPF
jgi:single-strand DNA-binding protein